MDIKHILRFFHFFVKVFSVLFVILVVMPWVVDHIIHYISGGMTPVNDSIKVFKDFMAEKAAMSRFLDVLKKFIIFM